MADSNKYRRGKEAKYKDSALRVKDVVAFLSKYNNSGERTCNMCAKKFQSEGAHNHICKNCKGKQENKYNNKVTRELIEYKTHQDSHITKAYRGD